MSEFITRVGDGEYQVIFKTDSAEKYHAVEDFCREIIDHGKPSGWISVKDRLPPIYQMVLITGKNGAGGSFGVIKGSYDGHNYNWYRDDIGHYVNSRGDIVTHWMPLPEPPKEET